MSLGFFRAIKGQFVLEKFKPDGDSLRFVPQDPERFRGLYREHMSLATDGGYQLRLEGIDAPETHYGAARQPQGDEARDHLLELLGISGVTREEQLITGCKPPRLPGTILTASFDPHGRPISYALLERDADGLSDGQELKVEAELLGRTLNARMLQDGFAYPLLYTSTPVAHQDYLRGAARQAQARGLGIWPHDRTPEFRLTCSEDLHAPAGSLIFPKFFRRSVDFLRHLATNQYVGDFPQWLAQTLQENDRVLLGKLEISLSQMFLQQNSRIRYQGDLLNLTFIEK